MAGGLWAQKIQLGRESTAGTPVAATTIWRGEGAMLQDNRTVTMVPERIGIATPTTRSYIGQIEGALSMAETPATYEQLPHILEAGIKTATPAADGSGSSGYIYTYTWPTTAANTIKTYTIETGDNQQAEEMEYSFVESFTISGNAGEAVMMSAEWIGRRVTNTTFTGALSVPTVEDILAQTNALWIDDGGGTIGTTNVVSTLLSFTLNVTTGWRPKYTIDTTLKYFDYAYFDASSVEATLDLTWEHNTAGVAEKTAFRDETVRLIRLQTTGSTYTTPGTATTYGTKALRIDAVGKYESFSALEDQDGNSIYNATLRLGYSPADAASLSIVVVNELSTLP